MRASGWNRIPIIRMINVSLEPGDWDFDDLIADTDDGIYMEMNRSWSIDDKRYNFQFGTEIGYEIKNGKLGRLLRNCTYTGHHARILEQLRRHLQRQTLDHVGHAQLRQRPARPDRPHRAWRRPGAFPQRASRSTQIGA